MVSLPALLFLTRPAIGQDHEVRDDCRSADGEIIGNALYGKLFPVEEAKYVPPGRIRQCLEGIMRTVLPLHSITES